MAQAGTLRPASVVGGRGCEAGRPPGAEWQLVFRRKGNVLYFIVLAWLWWGNGVRGMLGNYMGE